jgi:nucleoside-diphosphate-sugar epimerase
MRNRTALVVGAMNGTGAAIAGTLAQHGWTVVALVPNASEAQSAWQGPAPLPRWIEGDERSSASLATAASGTDVIVMALDSTGGGMGERSPLSRVEVVVAEAEKIGARIVVPTSIYSYDPRDILIAYETELETPTTKQGRMLREVEEMLAAASQRVPSLVIRAGEPFGPSYPSSWLSAIMVSPSKAIDRITLPDGFTGQSWAYLPDLAEATVRLLNSPERLKPHERLQFAGFCDPDGTRLAHVICKVIGYDVPIRERPWWTVRLASLFSNRARSLAQKEPRWKRPAKLDNSRLCELIGDEPETPILEAVATSLVALRCLEEPLLPQMATARHPWRQP